MSILQPPDPTMIPEPQIAGVIERINQLRADQRTAGERLTALLDRADEADAADVVAVADALAAGKPAPTADTAAAVRAQVAAAEREVAGYTLALERLETELAAAITERRDAALKALAKERDRRAASYLEYLSRAQQAREALEEPRAVARWLENFERDRRYHPTGFVRGWRNPANGDLVTAAEVFTHLREDANEPEPRRLAVRPLTPRVLPEAPATATGAVFR